MLPQAIYYWPSAAPLLILATTHLRLLARRAVKAPWRRIYLHCLDSFGPRPCEVHRRVRNSFFALLLLSNMFHERQTVGSITSVPRLSRLAAAFPRRLKAKRRLRPSKLIMWKVTKLGSESLNGFIGLRRGLREANGGTGTSAATPPPPPPIPSSSNTSLNII